MTELDRRNFIAGLTAILGSASLASLHVSAIEIGETFKPSGKAEFFGDREMEMIKLIADIIIPDTDTPGASKAGVHLYIDHMAGSWMTGEETALLTKCLDDINSGAQQRHGASFTELDQAAQVAIVQVLDDERGENKAYDMLKSYIVVGYYTSEIGATQELLYDPIPGPHREIPFSEVGRVWAT